MAKGLLFRITTIYVGVTLASLVVIPWRGVPVASSPFVAFQGHFGLPGAAPSWRSCSCPQCCPGNSCLYGTTRILASLAEEGLAPVRLRWRIRQGAPSSPVTMSSCFVLLAVLLELLTPTRLFALLPAASAMTGLVNWGIFVAHLRLNGAGHPRRLSMVLALA